MGDEEDVVGMDKAQGIYEQYLHSIRFKQSERLEEKCKRNERFYSGDQWKGVVSNGLSLIVYNFLKQIVLAKVSITASNELTMQYTSNDSKADPAVDAACKVFTAEAVRNWERLKMNYENQLTLIDAAITGIGATYWYWDESIKTGNKHTTKGDFCFEHIDVSEIHFANPRECDLQRQDFIILSKRKSLKKAKALAKFYEVPKNLIDKIEPNDDDASEYFDKREDVTYDGNNVTILYKLEKNNGKVYLTISTPNVMFTKEPLDTQFSIYPIAMMNWDTRKKFIFGEAEVTYMIPNQIAVNKLASLRHANALLFGSPKIVVDSTRISKYSNQVGGVLMVNGDVKGAFDYIQPQEMGIDVDKSINENIALTKETASVNDNLLGASRPENTSAIMLQQKQASIPLDMTKMRYYDYLEQVGRIWREFYINLYDFERQVNVGNEGEMMSYTGTELKDIMLDVKIDVGASTQWSEVVTVQTLTELLQMGSITPLQAIERYPANVIPQQQQLIDDMKKQQAMVEQASQQLAPPPMGQPPVGQLPVQQPPVEEPMEFTVDEMIAFLETLPADIQKAIAKMGEEDRLTLLNEMMVMSPDELKVVFDEFRS